MSANHDLLCPNQPEYHDGSILWPAICHCELIAAVRSDERQKSLPPWWSEEYHAGYRQGYDDAVEALAQRKDWSKDA